MAPLRNPYWYKLIKVFKNKESQCRITTGLTIPFIYGAYELLQVPFNNINDLINTILDSKTDCFPVIQRCPTIKKHIIMLADRSVVTRPCYNFNKEYSLDNSFGESFLFIDRNSWNLGRSIEKVCSNLNSEYVATIIDQKYSWDNKIEKWRDFNDCEIDLIKSLMSNKPI